MSWMLPSLGNGRIEDNRALLYFYLPSLPSTREGCSKKYQEFLAAKASALRFARPSITAASEPLVLTSLLKVER